MRMERRRAVRLVDIAEACGVSKAAAARALSRPAERSELSRATYERIRRTATTMGYRGPGLARVAGASLVAAAYGGVSPNLFGVGGHLAAIFAAALAESGRDLVLLAAGTGDGWIDRALARQAEGIALLWPEPPASVQAAARTGLPVVALDCAWELPLPRVLHDDRANGRLMAEHLIQLGHRRLAFVSGGPMRRPHASSALRLAGWRAGLDHAGLRGGELTLATPDDAAVLGAVLRGAQAPTAIGCANDSIAYAVLQLAASLGIAVPDQLSVIGCDASTGGAYPPLTTLYLHPEIVAKRGAQLLLDLAAGGAAPEAPILVLASLVLRASTAAPAGPARCRPARRRR